MSKLRLTKKVKIDREDDGKQQPDAVSSSSSASEYSEASSSEMSGSDDDIELQNDEFDVSDDDDDDDSDASDVAEKDNKFGRAVSAILSSKVKAHDRKDPILIRAKGEARKLEESKLDAKARRMLNAEKKAKLDGARVRDLLPTDDAKAREILEHEKALRKVAQRGVVKMFNAIHAAHVGPDTGSKVIGIDKQQKQHMSKEKFLDLIRSGGKKD